VNQAKEEFADQQTIADSLPASPLSFQDRSLIVSVYGTAIAFEGGAAVEPVALVAVTTQVI
jgi:hypothetical protein